MSRNWWAGTLSLGFSVLVLTACYTLVAVVLLLQSNLSELIERWGKDIQVSVYFKDETTSEQKKDFEEKVRTIKEVKEHKFVTKEMAMSDLKRRLGDYVPDTLLNGQDGPLLPDSADLLIQSNVTGIDLESTLRNLKSLFLNLSYVDEVIYGQDWVKNYAKFYHGFRLTAFFVSAVILFTSLFVIGYTIFGAISQRRSDIEIYELVGATKYYIFRPFLIEGILLGAITGGLAMLAAYGVHVAKESLVAEYLSFLMVGKGLGFFSVLEIVGFILLTAICSLVASFLSVQRISSGWTAAGDQ